MEDNFRKTFDVCPNCGSDQRFCEQLAQEVKDKGLGRPEWTLYFDNRSGGVFDQNRAILLPIGSKIPAYQITTDICMECGTIYASEIIKLQATIQRGNIPPLTHNPSAS